MDESGGEERKEREREREGGRGGRAKWWWWWWWGTLTLKPCKEKLLFDMHTAIQAKSKEREEERFSTAVYCPGVRRGRPLVV